MIRLALIDNTVENNNQTVSLGIDGTNPTAHGYELLDKVIDSRSIQESQVIVFNIKLKGNQGEMIIKRIRDSQAKICIFLSEEKNELPSKERVLTAVNRIRLEDNHLHSHSNEVTIVMNDGRAIDPKWEMGVLMLISNTQPANKENTTHLTKREVEIMNHLSKGLLYKEVAKKLGISAQTVKTHVKHIYSNLRVNNRTEAIIKFLQST